MVPVLGWWRDDGGRGAVVVRGVIQWQQKRDDGRDRYVCVFHPGGAGARRSFKRRMEPCEPLRITSVIFACLVDVFVGVREKVIYDPWLIALATLVVRISLVCVPTRTRLASLYIL